MRWVHSASTVSTCPRRRAACGRRYRARRGLPVPSARRAEQRDAYRGLSVDEWQSPLPRSKISRANPRLHQCNTVRRPARFGCWHGNTGAEIALDSEHGAETTISIRGGVHIVPRDFGLPQSCSKRLGEQSYEVPHKMPAYFKVPSMGASRGAGCPRPTDVHSLP